jgi:hypothetical protein
VGPNSSYLFLEDDENEDDVDEIEEKTAVEIGNGYNLEDVTMCISEPDGAAGVPQKVFFSK